MKAVWCIGVLALATVAVPLNAATSIDLGGYWQRWIAGEFYDSVAVPSSYRPVGTAVLRRDVNLPAVTEKQAALLRFEGIANEAVVRVNGHEAGRMGPWIPYEFDITRLVKPGRNAVEVEVTDWQAPLGPTGGWESYGGIVRAASIDIRPAAYVENLRLEYRLAPKYASADCSVDVFVRSALAGRARVTAKLLRHGNVVAQGGRDTQLNHGSATVNVAFSIAEPVLWSPDRPELYTVQATVISDAGEHTAARLTGFRELRIDGTHFVLNGRTLVLRGVARHDLWKDRGYTLTDEQIEQDMRTIKSMGANSVRMVHYPNDRRTAEAAARYGLLMSEETGLYWMDFAKAPRESIERGLTNLEALVRRDWNNPALFCIMLANESTPTVEIMREARRRAVALKPGLFVSAARVSGADGTYEGNKRLFDDAGFDFYTEHPYTYEMSVIERAADTYAGKPLIFSEWGGPTGRMPVMMDLTVAVLSRLVRDGKLSGHWFWEWADMPEFSRKDASMDNGILVEGVVTEGRTVRPEVFSRLSTLFRAEPGQAPKPDTAPRVAELRAGSARADAAFVPVSLQEIADSPEQKDARQSLDQKMADFWRDNGFTGSHWRETGGRFWSWSAKRVSVGPIPFEPPAIGGSTVPLVIARGASFEIPVKQAAARLHFLGNVTVPDGYPAHGRAGETIGRYTIRYADGTRQDVALRWGLEVARANRIAVATRLNPVALHAPVAVEYVKDASREDYQTLLFSVPVKTAVIDSVRIEMDGAAVVPPPSSLPQSTGSLYRAGDHVLLLFALTVEAQ